jgi:uncharacterized membrane protein YphA (DoxX/SURF4 family)
MNSTTAAATILVIPPYVLWPYIVGGALALIALFAARAAALRSPKASAILALMPLCLAAAFAAFGTEHLLLPDFIKTGVPQWIPWHLFWAYFIGIALLAAALSIATKVQVRIAATLLGIMLFIFVLTIHIPKVIATPHDRIAWAVALRDTSFSGGALALAAIYTEKWRTRGTHTLVVLATFMIAIPAIVFGVEHFLHPEFLPGVPLGKLTPLWVPGRVIIGYLTGAILFVAGILLLIGQKTRQAATFLGAWLVLLVLFIYLPMVIAIPSAADGGEKIEGVNYFFDTLLYSGAILALASALSGKQQTE